MSTVLSNPPLSGKLVVTSNFGGRIHPIYGGWRGHTGVDLGANSGTPVLAVADGKVVISKYDSEGYGYYTVIQHSGFFTLYGHMLGNKYKVGDRVSSKSIIGKVGSTGASTGPHLHFEIRVGSKDFWGSTPIDPMPVINGTTPITEADIATDDYASDTLSGETTALDYRYIIETYESTELLDVQPFVAIVDVWIGGEHITTIPPNYISSMEFTNISNSGGTCILTVFDRFSDEIEEGLIKYGNSVSIRFGHATGRQSRIFTGAATVYNVTQYSSGNILTVSIVLDSITSNLNAIEIDGGDSPSDAVKAIAEYCGWKIGRIDEARQIYEEGTNIKNFKETNRNPIEYILKEIAPRATRLSDGKGGYQFYFDTTVNPPTANFHPIDISTEGLRTYVYQKGKNSPVISFSVTTSLIASGTEDVDSPVLTDIEANGIDTITKEEYGYNLDVNSVYRDASGEYSTLVPGTSKALLDTKGMSYDEAVSTVQYRFTTKVSSAIKANATLVGDPTLEVGQQVRFVILTVKNKLHHTSGIYMITGVGHNISSGVMTTTLELIKYGDIQGPIELKSYSSLRK